jgi:cell division septum initiation protein DivIVA
MALTPEEFRHHGLEARRGRYAKAEVDYLLEEVFTRYDMLWREREHFRTRAEALETEIAGFRELEQALRDGILTGQRAAGEVVQDAERERDRILERARLEAEDLARSGREEVATLQVDIERLRALDSELESNYRAFLYAALRVLEHREPAPASSQDAPPSALTQAAEIS